VSYIHIPPSSSYAPTPFWDALPRLLNSRKQEGEEAGGFDTARSPLAQGRRMPMRTASVRKALHASVCGSSSRRSEERWVEGELEGRGHVQMGGSARQSLQFALCKSRHRSAEASETGGGAEDGREGSSGRSVAFSHDTDLQRVVERRRNRRPSMPARLCLPPMQPQPQPSQLHHRGSQHLAQQPGVASPRGGVGLNTSLLQVCGCGCGYGDLFCAQPRRPIPSLFTKVKCKCKYKSEALLCYAPGFVAPPCTSVVLPKIVGIRHAFFVLLST
jgi:hypothetical protein